MLISAVAMFFGTFSLIVNDPVVLGGEGVERMRLEAVLRRATASDPALRYPSVAHLVGDLIPALHALPTAAADPDAPTGAGVVTKTALKR